MWLKFVDWLKTSVLRVEELHWIERPNSFAKTLKKIITEQASGYMRDVHFQVNHVNNRTLIKGSATMTLFDGEYTFEDIVYFDGVLGRTSLHMTIKCEAIYHGVIPSMNVKLRVNDKVFSGVVGLTMRFKRELDVLHLKHSRNSTSH